MYTKRFIEPEIIWYFSWKPLTYTLLLSIAVYVVYHYAGLHKIALPFLPIATVGTAVAFYVGFKNNSSYDRLWEARKIWGELTNLSRAIVSYLLAAVKATSEEHDVTCFVRRQIAYVNVLRLQLRRRNVWDDSNEYTRMSRECFTHVPFEEAAMNELKAYCPQDAGDLYNKRNIACELLHLQMEALSSFKQQGLIDSYEHSDMMRLCNDLYGQQGKAERIKTFPFPRQYAFFSEVFVYIFVTLLPFGLIGEFAKISANHEWLVIPFANLISWIFITMEKVGDTSENPFEGSMNDVPMSAICRNIEIDLMSMAGASELPPPIEAEHHVLM